MVTDGNCITAFKHIIRRSFNLVIVPSLTGSGASQRLAMLRPRLLLLSVVAFAYAYASTSGCVGDCTQVSEFETIVPKAMLPPVKTPITVCGKDIQIVRRKGENAFMPDESELKPCPERVAFSTEMRQRIHDLQFPDQCPPENEVHTRDPVIAERCSNRELW